MDKIKAIMWTAAHRQTYASLLYKKKIPMPCVEVEACSRRRGQVGVTAPPLSFIAGPLRRHGGPSTQLSGAAIALGGKTNIYHPGCVTCWTNQNKVTNRTLKREERNVFFILSPGDSTYEAKLAGESDTKHS